MSAWGQSHKTILRVNLLAHFCKLDHLVNIRNIYGIFMKRSSLQNSKKIYTKKVL